MKLTTLFLALGGLLLSSVAASAQSDVKIVTVSVQRLFDGYYKKDGVDARLQSVQQEAQAELTTRQQTIQAKEQEVLVMREEFQDLQAEFADNPLLSDEAKQEQLGAKELEIRTAIQEGQQMLQEFQQWQQATNQRLQRRQQELRNTLIEEIKEVVVAVANDENADLVLDTSDILNMQVTTVLYADPRLDITNKVLNTLNADAP